ncbi:MAG: hypothetical protein KAW12_21415, partial [Candidatus Aminicenantes bacterium]|nr:hypothetical protein [Candidatus Aminicenantes bacterium]
PQRHPSQEGTALVDLSENFEKRSGLAGKQKEAEWEKRQRQAVHPLAERFLQYLTSCATKTLITTRLTPFVLEELSGVSRVFLAGLSPADAVDFMRNEGVLGTRAELEGAGKVYNNHPLMVKLLCSAVKRSRKKDIQSAYTQNIIEEEKPQKILNRSFDLLSKEEKEIASTIAVFRGVFDFASAQALFPKIAEERLWQSLMELRSLGFLFYDERGESFDFHPILRSFLYDSLTDRAAVHDQAVVYFQALPEEKKVVTLDDLTPVIELYFHLVKAGKYDEARELFHARIDKPTYYQLSAYQLQIELLKGLFPDGESHLPKLKNESDQALILNDLANVYALSGLPQKAVPLFKSQMKLREKQGSKKNLAIGLGNVAHMAQLPIGQLCAAAGHLRKSIELYIAIETKFDEAIGHRELGRALAFRGWVRGLKNHNPSGRNTTAEDELDKSTAYWKKTGHYQGLSVDYAYRCLFALMQARLSGVQTGQEKKCAALSLDALAHSIKSLDYCELKAKSRPNTRDFVRAYWLLGEALVQCHISGAKVKPFEAAFYDEHFQQVKETLPVQPGAEITAAERCLHEALRRCRRVNLVEMEADILIGCARLEWAKAGAGKKTKGFTEAEKLLREAHNVALRNGYRLRLADLHLLCAQILLGQEKPGKLLDLPAAAHLQKTEEYALDVSEFDDLYKSEDAHFYDNIPEYEMLKRGLSDAERIENGYRVAYSMAEALEKKL